MHDPVILQFLPWELKSFIYLSSSLLVAVITLLIPKRTLVWASQKPLLSPSWITFWHILLVWFGAFILFYINTLAGLLLIVEGCCLDVVDGKQAKAMQLAGIIRTKLELWFGAWFDPLADKLALLPLIGVLGARGIIHPFVVTCIISFDIIGSLLRDPFNLGERLIRIIKRRPALSWHPYRAHLELTASVETAEAKANPIGKIKSLLQALGLALCGPYIFQWIEPSEIPTYWFSVTAVLGLMSVVSRHLNVSTVRRTLQRLQKSHFEHEDI